MVAWSVIHIYFPYHVIDII